MLTLRTQVIWPWWTGERSQQRRVRRQGRAAQGTPSTSQQALRTGDFCMGEWATEHGAAKKSKEVRTENTNRRQVAWWGQKLMLGFEKWVGGGTANTLLMCKEMRMSNIEQQQNHSEGILFLISNISTIFILKCVEGEADCNGKNRRPGRKIRLIWVQMLTLPLSRETWGKLFPYLGTWIKILSMIQVHDED